MSLQRTTVRSVSGTLALGVLAASFLTTPAHATPPRACTEAYLRAQILKKEEKLTGAREELRVCAQASCPALIVNDCTQWLDEVAATLPSVVPIAADVDGKTLLDVTLSIDGAPYPEALAGKTIDIDPGVHRFRFERTGFVATEAELLVGVGERNKRVFVTLHRAGERTAARPPLGTAGLVIAGAGLVALGVGAVFGGLAVSKQSAADCPNNACGPSGNPNDIRTAITDGDVSTAFFVAGGVVAAAGVATWLLAPAKPAGGSGWVVGTPVALANGGGFVLSGAW